MLLVFQAESTLRAYATHEGALEGKRAGAARDWLASTKHWRHVRIVFLGEVFGFTLVTEVKYDQAPQHWRGHEKGWRPAANRALSLAGSVIASTQRSVNLSFTPLVSNKRDAWTAC